jgi:hypothetical protein
MEPFIQSFSGANYCGQNPLIALKELAFKRILSMPKPIFPMVFWWLEYY